MKQLYSILILLMLSLIQLGCEPTILEKVLIKNREASPNEVQVFKIVRDEEEIVAKLRMQLKQDDELKTDKNTTFIILFPGKTEVLVKPQTHVKITSTLFIFSGEIYVKTNGSFEVETKHATIIREGTEFLVNVTEREEVSVIVLDGKVGLKPKAKPEKIIYLTKYEQGNMLGINIPVKSNIITARAIIEDILKSVKPIDPIIYTPIIVKPTTAGICTVPNVTNMLQTSAEGILNIAGFSSIKKTIKRYSNPGDWVHNQKPVHNTQVSCDVEIQLIVAAK